MKGTVVDIVEGIEPLPEVVGIKTGMVLTDGGATPPHATTVMGVQGLPDELVLVASIIAHQTNYCLGEFTSGGNI
jgi:hypothetical protein